jgi:hypothetical protein
MIEIRHKDLGVILLRLRRKSLVRVNLSGAELDKADLAGVDLTGARFTYASLNEADLSNSGLIDVDFELADLNYANLDNTTLGSVKLYMAHLVGCSLKNTSLEYTDFKRCYLRGADFTGATAGSTSFLECDDLHLAKGLESITHGFPTFLDRETLQNSVHGLPDVFLEGCGYTRLEIETLRALYTNSPIRYFSCFISHAEGDLPFADRLLADLRQNNVTCWQYKGELRGGRHWEDQINAAIKKHDKLIVVCSRQAVYRPNVIKEILAAMDQERATGEQKLFPVMLDRHILSSEMMEDAREQTRSGAWRENWVHHARKYHIPDFSGWDTDNTKYQLEFGKLLEALRNPGPR